MTTGVTLSHMAKYERILVVSDTHGLEMDKKWKRKMMKFMGEWNPHTKIHLGDWSDQVPIRGGASPEEKQVNLGKDIEAGENFLVEFGADVIIEGNHDWRVRDLAKKKSAGIAMEYAQDLVGKIDRMYRDLKATAYPYDSRAVHQIGKLKFIHGFKAGIHSARGHLLVYDHVVSGHVHRFVKASDQGHPEPKFGMTIGCGCGLDPDYAQKQTAKLGHQKGWAFGVINKDSGDYEMWDVKENSEGDYMTPFGKV